MKRVRKNGGKYDFKRYLCKTLSCKINCMGFMDYESDSKNNVYFSIEIVNLF